MPMNDHLKFKFQKHKFYDCLTAIKIDEQSDNFNVLDCIATNDNYNL